MYVIKGLVYSFVAVVLVLSPASSLATDVTPTTVVVDAAAVTPSTLADNPEAMIDGAVVAAEGKQFNVLVGFILMLALWIFRRILPNLPAKVTPWAAIGVSTVGYLSEALVAGGNWQTAIISGILTGLSAVGIWELTKGYFKNVPG